MLEVALGGYTPTEKICRSKSTNQSGDRNEHLPDLCFSIYRFSQVVSIPRAQPHAQSLFLFPIVFGINLIHFFDGKKDGSIVCFGDSIPCHDIWQKQNFAANDAYCFEECNVFGNEKCELNAIQEGRKRCKFLARKSAKLFANTKVHIFGKEKCKTHRQFQRYFGDVTSVSLSLSLCISLSHRAHLTHNIGSASALPIIKKNHGRAGKSGRSGW